MASLFTYEIIHYQYVNGFISEERWISAREAIKGRLGHQVGGPTRTAYEGSKRAWSERFRQVMEDIIAEIDAENGQ